MKLSELVKYIPEIDNLDEPTKELVEKILLATEEIESEVNSKRISFGVKSRAEKGLFHGGVAPLGYTRSGNSLVVEQEGANVVRIIFHLYLKGYGYHKIAKILDEEEYLTPSEHQNVELKKKSYWSANSVMRILKNPIYIGKLVCGRYSKDKSEEIVVENSVEPIISTEDFYQVQKVMESKKKTILRRTVKEKSGHKNGQKTLY